MERNKRLLTGSPFDYNAGYFGDGGEVQHALAHGGGGRIARCANGVKYSSVFSLGGRLDATCSRLLRVLGFKINPFRNQAAVAHHVESHGFQHNARPSSSSNCRLTLCFQQQLAAALCSVDVEIFKRLAFSHQNFAATQRVQRLPE